MRRPKVTKFFKGDENLGRHKFKGDETLGRPFFGR